MTTYPNSFSIGYLHASAAGQEVIDDFLGETVKVGEIVGAFEAFVSATEEVEAGIIRLMTSS